MPYTWTQNTFKWFQVSCSAVFRWICQIFQALIHLFHATISIITSSIFFHQIIFQETWRSLGRWLSTWQRKLWIHKCTVHLRFVSLAALYYYTIYYSYVMLTVSDNLDLSIYLCLYQKAPYLSAFRWLLSRLEMFNWTLRYLFVPI